MHLSLACSALGARNRGEAIMRAGLLPRGSSATTAQADRAPEVAWEGTARALPCRRWP